MSSEKRILYICHDGDLYGSQHSLNLIVSHLNRSENNGPYRIYVSIARPGPFYDLLKQSGTVKLLRHKRTQWFKHDRRSIAQRAGDVPALIIGSVPRALNLANLIKKHRIDLVHTNSVVSLEGALAAKITGVPHVWHIRELFVEDNPKLIPVLGKQTTCRIIDRLSDKVVCISKAVRDQFGNPAIKNPHKYPVIHNALDLSEETAGTADITHESLPPKNRSFRLGFIGRMSAGKRFGDVLDALAILTRTDPGITSQIEVVAAGSFVDETQEKLIEKKLAQLAGEPPVHMLGQVRNLDALYATLDLLAVPSLNEPFGRVVIEAMAKGVPCVAAAAGGIPEILTDGRTGLLFPPKDTQALAGRIAECVRQPEKLAAIRTQALREVGVRFNIEAQVRQLDQLYRELLGNPSS